MKGKYAYGDGCGKGVMRLSHFDYLKRPFFVLRSSQ